MYNRSNVFYKILQNEVSAKKAYEDDQTLAFYDVNPVCRVHVLVIPKALYVDFHDFVSKALPEDVGSFFSTVAKVAMLLGLEESGYRIISNIGKDSRQEVPHFHVHILGGEPLRASLA
ncbi:MAG: HIT domain-containing protein [Holosporaceae bacterium]|jgi:diadenosine tetraphosphate (Ap4A) HIT family hydrolase|nr:HIT domain-containing protein [Holosporaceae bacterium]